MLRYITALAVAAAILAGPALAGNPPAIEWQRTFGSPDTSGRCIQQTADGGFLVAGRVQSGFANPDMYLLKTDPVGHRQWERRYGGPKHDYAFSVRQTSDGGFIVAGSGLDSSRAVLLKTDSLGDSLWIYAGPRASCAMDVQQTSDGGYIAAGMWESTWRVHLIKLDSQGLCEWTRQLPGAYSERPSGRFTPVQQTLDGGYVTAAEGILKTNTLGILEWSRTYDDVTAILSVTQMMDGGYVATGIGRNPVIPWHTQNIILLKVNSQGQQVWKKIVRGPSPSHGRLVRQTSDGGLFVVGYSAGPYLVRASSQGTVLWKTPLQGAGYALARWGEQTADGGYVVVANNHLYKLGPDGQ